jgi:hypothetical protein
MILTKNAAIVSMAAFLIALTGPVDAARPKAKQNNNNAMIHGMVTHKGKPVAGAHVHVVHHSAHRAKVGKAAVAVKAKPKVAAAGVHHGTMSAANGTFAMKHHHHNAMVTLVAHKKHVGSGHARAAAGANVTIRLHKHHHHHGK